MQYINITAAHFGQLCSLHAAYKAAIGEAAPTQEQLCGLQGAIERGEIHFYGCLIGDRLVACCSISCAYSTFSYDRAGVFEDFYILPELSRRGIAKELVQYAVRESGVSALTVGSAGCDIDMYRALGFCFPLGSLLAFDFSILT